MRVFAYSVLWHISDKLNSFWEQWIYFAILFQEPPRTSLWRQETGPRDSGWIQYSEWEVYLRQLARRASSHHTTLTPWSSCSGVVKILLKQQQLVLIYITTLFPGPDRFSKSKNSDLPIGYVMHKCMRNNTRLMQFGVPSRNSVYSIDNVLQQPI